MPEQQVQYELTDRGFKHYAPIHPTPTSEIRVYESSNAEEPSLWVSITQLRSAENGSGWESIQLTLPQAELLRDQLSYAVHNHYSRQQDQT